MANNESGDHVEGDDADDLRVDHPGEDEDRCNGKNGPLMSTEMSRRGRHMVINNLSCHI